MAFMLAVLGAAVFTWLSLSRHAAFQSHAFDLGNMDQAVWNTLHGHLLRFTDMQVGARVYTTRLAIHVEPLLIPISLLYLVHSGPQTLLVLQAVVVASGAIPAYLLGRDLLGPRAALVFPAAYLLHPSLQNVVLDDFHAVAMSATFLLWALLYGWRNRAVPFVAWGVLAASTKEEVSLTVALLAVLFVARGRWRIGAAVVAAGVGWFAICMLVIVPHFNPAGHSPYLARYAYLGNGFGAVLSGILHHPRLAISTLLSLPRQTYLYSLLHPLGMVPIAGFPVLVASLPAFLINGLSADPSMYSGYYQYSAEIVPIAVGSSAMGIASIVTRMRRVSERGARLVMPMLLALVAVGAVADTWRYGFTPLAYGYIVPSAGPHQRLEQRLLDTIPGGASVAAADEMEPHLSDRRWVYLLPTVHPRNGPEADWIALDASIAGLPVTPLRLHHTAAVVLRHGYGVAAARDGLLILHRGTRTRRLPPGFFSFLYAPAGRARAVHRRIGPLELVASLVHPRERLVNRSRPAIGVETYWRVLGPVPKGMRIYFAMSRVYSGTKPPSAFGAVSGDSPAWDWLPLRQWPHDRTVHAASVPLIPPPYSSGQVAVWVVVSPGPVDSPKARRVLLDTITVDW